MQISLFTIFYTIKNSAFRRLDKSNQEIAENGDVNILFMKFNRKGTYVAFKEHLINKGWRCPVHVKYNSEKYGTWLFLSTDEFWEYNTERFEYHCVSGVDAYGVR